MSVNFNDLLKAADDAGFSAVPPNEYDVEVVKAEAKKAGTGKNQIVVQFKIIAGPHAGKSVFNNFVITVDNPNALGFFFRHMAALGVPRAVFEQNPPLEQVAASLVGKRATIKVSVREWNGQEKNGVDSVRPFAGAGGATPFVPGLVQPQPMGIVPPQPPIPSVPTTSTAPFVPEPVPPLTIPETNLPPAAPEIPF